METDSMFSPYEELEYLQDFLPSEGESVLVTRQHGELVCKPWSQDALRNGIEEAELYGRLVQANERLAATYAWPMWMGTIVLFWFAVGLHVGLGLNWTYWSLTPALALPVYYFALTWGRMREQELFRKEILPGLRHEMALRGISYFELVAGVRQHAELRNLLDELIQRNPQREPASVIRAA
jgi:hypothetical protein